MSFKKFIIILLCFLSICYSAGPLLDQIIPVQGLVTMQKKWKGLKIRVAIFTRKFSTENSKDIDSIYIARCCTKSRNPCSIVDSIGISYNGRAVFIPFMVYCSLSDLSRGDLFVENERCYLKLQGGDASESYCARIDFDSTAVIQSIRYRGITFSDTFALTQYKYLRLE
jgi:hypothetical protein